MNAGSAHRAGPAAAAVDAGERPAARPAGGGAALCGVPGRRRDPAAAVPRRGAGLRRRPARACRTRRPPRSSCCTAPRWCMTTCPASTMPRRGAASLRCTAPSASALAVLAGDALIVLAFETLAPWPPRRAGALAALLRIIGRSRRHAGRHRRRPGLGMRAARRRCRDYQRAKTGALFAAATVAGAAAAGVGKPSRGACSATARRGLPGGRRHPRRGRRRDRASASRSGATRRWAAECGEPSWADGRDRAAASGWWRRSQSIPDCPGADALRGADPGRDPGACCPRDAGCRPRRAACRAPGARARAPCRPRWPGRTAIRAQPRRAAGQPAASGAGRRRFPLTRPIARRRARELFDLCAGFVYSQVLLACVRLRLFEILAEGAADRATHSRSGWRCARGGRTAARRRGRRCACRRAAAATRYGARGARRGAGRQRRHRGDGRAPRHALRRPARSGGAAAPRPGARRAVAVLGLCGRRRSRRG